MPLIVHHSMERFNTPNLTSEALFDIESSKFSDGVEKPGQATHVRSPLAYWQNINPLQGPRESSPKAKF